MNGRSLAALVAGAVAILGARAATPSPAVLMLSPADRDAVGRVAIAEAANQGDSGIAAVVQAILNRLASGRWGSTIETVVDAPHQFGPVARAGGDWRRLPQPTEAQRARVDTILTLIADGRMPDFISGALYFQNPRIVASRIAAGATAAARLNFGGKAPVAVIGDHAFYAGRGPEAHNATAPSVDPIFIEGLPSTSNSVGTSGSSSQSSAVSAPGSERELFILSDGRLVDDLARATSDH